MEVKDFLMWLSWKYAFGKKNLDIINFVNMYK